MHFPAFLKYYRKYHNLRSEANIIPWERRVFGEKANDFKSLVGLSHEFVGENTVANLQSGRPVMSFRSDRPGRLGMKKRYRWPPTFARLRQLYPPWAGCPRGGVGCFTLVRVKSSQRTLFPTSDPAIRQPRISSTTGRDGTYPHPNRYVIPPGWPGRYPTR